MSKNKKYKTKKYELTKGIFSVLNKQPSNTFNYKQIASKLNIEDPNSREMLIKRLDALARKGKIEEVSRGVYKAMEIQSYFQGVVDMTSNGNAYIKCDELENDVFVSSNLLNKALHGDVVEVYVFPRFRDKKRQEGEITKIIERKKERFVGIVQMQKNFAFVLPSDHRMYTDIFVSKNDTNGAKDGDKVIVRIDKWKEKSDSPQGVIEKILGKPGESNTEMNSILAEYGLPSSFPFEVEEFAKSLDTSISEEEIAKRRDMRDVLTFTIDPKDAKDFDDALSFQILENGNYEIGIHIADVSHYVQPDTILDEEAFNRATSIYLVDRVVPMLPEVLSNFACSLRPNEEKYTFSAVFELDKNAEIKKSWFGRTVTYSDQRFSYEEAQSIIENVESSASYQSYEMPDDISLTNLSYKVDKKIVEAVITLDKLAKKIT